MADLTQTFHEILNQPDAFSNLRAEMTQLRVEGVSKQEIYTALESLRTQVTEAQDDIILEGMDVLVGFCSPHVLIT
jgi:hypothetical protein